MGCFESLVKSNFLANALSELSLARTTLKAADQAWSFPYLSSSRSIQRRAYNYYIHDFDLLKELSNTYESTTDDHDMLYYVRIDNVSYVYSRSRSQISDAVQYTYNIFGEIPVYRGRHKVNGYVVHTALFDGGFTFTPYSAN